MYIILFVEHTIFLTLAQDPLRSKAESYSRHAQALQLLVSHGGVRWNVFSRQRPRPSLNAVLDKHLLKLSNYIIQIFMYLT